MSVQPDPMFTSKRKAALPYAGTTGAAGSDASRERAENEAADGTAYARQSRILDLLDSAGTLGMTWKEISDHTGEHHGKVSGALSSMHKAGSIVALKFNRRNGSGVYVLPPYVMDRPVREFRSNSQPEDGAVEKLLRDYLARPRLTDTERAMVARIRPAIKSDKPIMLKPETARMLISALIRLDSDQSLAMKPEAARALTEALNRLDKP
jgi:hypothetical protein